MILRRRCGYALRDLLVIVAVNIALIGLLVFAVQKVRSEAARMKAHPSGDNVHYRVVPVPRTTPTPQVRPASSPSTSSRPVQVAHVELVP